MQREVSSVQEDMQQRLAEALKENEAQAGSLRDARERNMHFSARLVALNARVAQLTKQLKESQQREQALSADLEAAKKAHQEAQQQLLQAQEQVAAAAQAVKDQGQYQGHLATPSPSHRSMDNGLASPMYPGECFSFVQLPARMYACEADALQATTNRTAHGMCAYQNIHGLASNWLTLGKLVA